ncbi:MAG: hypothetical protein LBK12_01190 [Odoribacteraceae bacterium]|jgi:hypothetical protein|nr:hypothetical protein [Odoribacteraceae bacterium]
MRHLFFSLLCASALFCACSKDDNKGNKNYQACDFIQENLNAAKQTFRRTVSDQPTELTLNNGVKLTIPGGDVFTKNGVPITGEYTIEVNTMLKPSQIILAGTNTNLRGRGYLESDGFFHVAVSQNGQPVDEFLKNYLSVSIPTDKDDWTQTQIWEGNGSAQEQFAWEEIADTVLNFNDNMPGEINTVFSLNKNFSFQFKKLGWFNCDVLWSVTGTSTTVTVALTGKFGALADYLGYAGDTFVFFKGKGSNVLAQLYTMVNTTTVKSYDNSMPIDAEGTLLAFSIKDGAYAYATKEIKVTTNLQETLDLLPTTKEAVFAALEALDR